MVKSSSVSVIAQRIGRGARQYPAVLLSRMGVNAPATLTIVGRSELLGGRRTALFCSARTPGDAILHAHDAAARMRDGGVTVISGFHSPIEKECLRILLRGEQSIIICPGRAIETMRIPTECRHAFDVGRVLFLSVFMDEPRRVTKASALHRNEVVAALADEAYIAHSAAGSQTERIAGMLGRWGVPTSSYVST